MRYKRFMCLRYLKTLLSLFCFCNMLFAGQTINVIKNGNYNLAGNGINDSSDSNYGRFYTSGSPTSPSDKDFYNPSTYGASSDASNNAIIVHANIPYTAPNLHGSFAWPFLSTNTVAYNATDVDLEPFIHADSNTVIIYCSNTDRNVYGARELTNFGNSIMPKDNIINSAFSFSGNSVIISSISTIKSIVGANLSLQPKDNVNLDSSIYLNNNRIICNSSATVFSLAAVNLTVASDANVNRYVDTSICNNTIEINDFVSVTGSASTNVAPDITLAKIDLGSCYIKNLIITNNSITFSKSGINMPDSDVKAYDIICNINKILNQNITNNVLKINNAKDIILGSINNFDTYVFNLPDNFRNNDTIITLSNQIINIPIDAKKLSISNYDYLVSPTSINLIDSYGSGNITIFNSNGSYLFDTRTQLKVIDKMLIFTFDPTIAPSPVDPIDPSHDPNAPLPDTVTLDPQTIVISQAGAANISFVSQGLDLIMDEGIFSAKNQAARTKASFVDYDIPFLSSKGLSPFAAFSASKNKFFSSSSNDIDVNGFSIIAGLAKDSSICDHNLTLGLFFEHGNSKFETSNFFNYDPTDDFTVAGKGNSHYNGAGFLARLDFINNIYLDASARLGNAFSDYFSSDLTKLSYFSFDYSTTYYGAHAGLGYLLTLNDALALDLSSKYFFTNLAGKEVDLPENQSVSFDTESVQKVKIGAKLQINDNGIVNAFFGGGFEYEPYNKIEATIRQLPVDTPELGGGRGIIEAGFNSSYKNLSVDLSSKYSDGNAGNSISGLLKFSYMI